MLTKSHQPIAISAHNPRVKADDHSSKALINASAALLAGAFSALIESQREPLLARLFEVNASQISLVLTLYYGFLLLFGASLLASSFMAMGALRTQSSPSSRLIAFTYLAGWAVAWLWHVAVLRF
jgi:hypothetical protein